MTDYLVPAFASDGSSQSLLMKGRGGGRTPYHVLDVVHYNVLGDPTTRPANTTAYLAGQSISNNQTAGSVTATSVSVSDENDAPIDIMEILLDTNDTGVIGTNIRLHVFNSDPTANSGVGAGNGATWSNKKAGWIGSFAGLMRGFSDGGKGVLVPEEGNVRICNPSSGGKLLYYQLVTITGFQPSAVSTVFTPRFKGLQGRAA